MKGIWASPSTCLPEDINAWWNSIQPDSYEGWLVSTSIATRTAKTCLFYIKTCLSEIPMDSLSMALNMPRRPAPQTPYRTYHRGIRSKLLRFDFYIRSQYFNLPGQYFCAISKVTYTIQKSYISSTLKMLCANFKLHMLNIFEGNNVFVFAMISR